MHNTIKSSHGRFVFLHTGNIRQKLFSVDLSRGRTEINTRCNIFIGIITIELRAPHRPITRLRSAVCIHTQTHTLTTIWLDYYCWLDWWWWWRFYAAYIVRHPTHCHHFTHRHTRTKRISTQQSELNLCNFLGNMRREFVFISFQYFFYWSFEALKLMGKL